MFIFQTGACDIFSYHKSNMLKATVRYILVWIYLISGKCDLICTFCSNNLFSFIFCLLVSVPIYYLCAFFLMYVCVYMSRWGMWLWMVILEPGQDGKLAYKCEMVCSLSIWIGIPVLCASLQMIIIITHLLKCLWLVTESRLMIWNATRWLIAL